MSSSLSSYRPHDPGHDYYAPGIYLITLVIRDRTSHPTLLGHLNDDLKSPSVIQTETGKAVMEEWGKTPSFEASKGRKVKLHAAVCMPDHFHGVIEVMESMDKSLGQVIWGFKVACTKRWRAISSSQEQAALSSHPTTAANACALSPAAEKPSLVSRDTVLTPAAPSFPMADLHRMSKKQRAEYYAAHPEALRPLWDDNYDDTICLSNPATGEYSERHFAAMVRYVEDNPRRAVIRRMRPQFMQRCLHVRIGNRDYAAFGNLFLLRWAKKVQVFCHRKARLSQLSAEERQRYGYATPRADMPSPIPYEQSAIHHADMPSRIPYEQTAAYRAECAQWEAQVMAGATVIVTPGISRGEQGMKDRCLENGWPLIHLQKEPIGAYWKPEERRFNACANGSLLILAPWEPDALGDVNGVPSATAYSVFHNLNSLAEEICMFDGDARVVNG